MMEIAPTEEDNMYRLLLTATAATAILTTTSLIPNCAAAIPLRGKSDIPTALELVTPIDKGSLRLDFAGWIGPGLFEAANRHRNGDSFLPLTTVEPSTVFI